MAGAANPRQLEAVRHFLQRHRQSHVLRTFIEPKWKLVEPTPTPSPWFDCPTTFGLYPDPYDCNAYFQCSYGVPFEERCQPGLEFNPVSASCDFPENINPPCQAIPYPTAKTEILQPAGGAVAAAVVQAPAVLKPAASEVHVHVPVLPERH